MLGRPKCAYCHKRHRAGIACRVRDREEKKSGNSVEGQVFVLTSEVDAKRLTLRNVIGVYATKNAAGAEKFKREEAERPSGRPGDRRYYVETYPLLGEA